GLQKTKPPLAPPAGKAPPKPAPAQEAVFQKIQDVLGRKGTMAGTVLQLGIPRAEPIQDGGMEVPPSMGMANAINFETVESRVATTGHFVLIAEVVNPVIRELQAHGIEATALHSHMLRENPRLVLMHFWGFDPPVKIADKVSPSNHVLVQESSDPTDYRFPLAVVKEETHKDVTLSVRAKPVSGRVDQGFGMVWRYKDANNYYITRCNADEDNCTIYHTV